MDDLISRQAAIECLIDALYDLDEADYVDKTFIEEELKKVPSVQPEQKTGRWIEIETDNYDTWRCSECDEYFCLYEGTPQDNEYYYCPNCGAKMRMERCGLLDW